MEETKEVAQTRKFTYEELENIAANLSSQVQQLGARLQEANMFNMFKRLDYCFKVLETSSTLFSPEFIERCAKEIEELMTPPAPETEKEPEDKE